MVGCGRSSPERNRAAKRKRGDGLVRVCRVTEHLITRGKLSTALPSARGREITTTRRSGHSSFAPSKAADRSREYGRMPREVTYAESREPAPHVCLSHEMPADAEHRPPGPPVQERRRYRDHRHEPYQRARDNPTRPSQTIPSRVIEFLDQEGRAGPRTLGSEVERSLDCSTVGDEKYHRADLTRHARVLPESSAQGRAESGRTRTGAKSSAKTLPRSVCGAHRALQIIHPPRSR